MDAPASLTARTLTVDDVDDVVAMINVCELNDTGELMWERADLLADSATDGFDRGADWVGVFDGADPVAWAMVLHLRSGWADVHPAYRERGIGTWLRRWTEDRAREKGSPRIGQTLDDVLPGPQALLLDAGYTPRHTSWILQMDHAERPPNPEPPPGVTLRPWCPEDTEPMVTMFEAAFAEWPDRLPSTPATWRAMTVEREGFVPDDLILAHDDGGIIGGAFILDADEIWVDKLAVSREARHRGVARALLLTAFQRSFDRGYPHTRLSTDSKTGALTLYERIGMYVTRSYTHLALDL